MMAELECKCGWEAEVTEARHGQSFGGTVGDRLARHEANCDEQTVKLNGNTCPPTSVNYVFEGDA